MQVIRTKSELRKTIVEFRKQGKTIGFVPTMGALHDGHLSLVDIAAGKADIVVMSIFVNPAQFAPNEDFDKYPRNEKSDLAKLQGKRVDIVYLPSIEEVYVPGASVAIAVGSIGKELEGVARPHFFDGVALVVTKLFMQVMPDFAVFGQKDYQQLVVIKKLVRELDINVEIIGAAICREGDGLAMSSRNVYLSPVQRAVAQNLYKIMNLVKEKIIAGGDVAAALKWGAGELVKSGFESVDYLELRSADTLMPVSSGGNARLLAVARLGGIRLLDNIEI